MLAAVAARAGHGVFLRVDEDLVLRRGHGVDTERVGQLHEVEQHVGDLGGHGLLLFGLQGAALGLGHPLEVFEQFAGFDVEGTGEVLGGVELLPVAFGGEGGELVAEGGEGVGHGGTVRFFGLCVKGWRGLTVTHEVEARNVVLALCRYHARAVAFPDACKSQAQLFRCREPASPVVVQLLFRGSTVSLETARLRTSQPPQYGRMTETARPPEKSLRIGFAAVLSAVAAVLAAGSAALHFIGTIWHQNYLAHWDIDANLFPRSTEQTLLAGYYAVLERGVMFWLFIAERWPWMLLGACGLIALGFFIDWLTDRGVDVTAAWINRSSRKARLIAAVILAGLAIVSIVQLGVVVVVAAMLLPAGVAEAAAGRSAELAMKDHAKGCERSVRRCIEVRRADGASVKGYLLDSSPNDIAIYDVESGRGRTMSRQGVEIVSTRPLKSL